MLISCLSIFFSENVSFIYYSTFKSFTPLIRLWFFVFKVFMICFKILVCPLGPVSSKNCVTLVKLKFLLLHGSLFVCLLLLLVWCCFSLLPVFIWFVLDPGNCVGYWGLNTFFPLSLCVKLWQTLKSLANKIELFKVVLTSFVRAGQASPWLLS